MSDLASRYLGLVVRLLPSSRRAWGLAMRAELATLERPSERRRFALGCTRAALLPSAATQAAGRRSPRVALAAWYSPASTSWPARRAARSAPPRARAARLAGSPPELLRPGASRPRDPRGPLGRVCARGRLSLALVVAEGASGLLRPDSLRWGTAFTLILTLVAAAFLAMTARDSRAGGRALAGRCRRGARRRSGGVRRAAVRTRGNAARPWPPRTRNMAGAAGLRRTGRGRAADRPARQERGAGRHGSARRRRLGGAVRSVARAECDRLPARSGAGHRRPRHAAGSTAAQRQLENSIEASDPYFGLLVFGASLAAVLWVMARPPTRAGTTVALLVALGLPAFGLAASARDFPGAAALATAALAVLIGAVATARPARHAREGRA